jgi:hypothetical protein
MKIIARILVVTFLVFPLVPRVASAQTGPVGTAAHSLLIPGWGQYENGEFNTTGGKAKVTAMAVIEVAAIITTAVVGATVGLPAAWAGIGVLIANHTWAAVDAFAHAKAEPSIGLGTEPPIEKTGQVM